MTRFGRYAVIIASLALASLQMACSEMGPENIFEPEVGHPETWVADHGSAALSQGDSCPDCHGTDLGGGVSGLSCFTLNFNDGGCHESGGELRHTEGWALPREHGRAAMSRPGVSTGLGSCQACHGLEYDGGTSETACASCHDVEAPHPPAPWLDGFSGHDGVDELNAHFCSDCHDNDESQEVPGCFNGSLCHGEKGSHSADWALGERHGAAAMEDPLESGFEECSICHGEDFGGGTSDVSCFTCHGIEAVHPGDGWLEGGEGHYDVHEDNAVTCALCHEEISSSSGCFEANECHVAVPEVNDFPDEPPPEEPEPDPPPEEPPPEEPPAEEPAAPENPSP